MCFYCNPSFSYRTLYFEKNYLRKNGIRNRRKRRNCKYAGINVKAITASVYILCGVMAALSGILTAARMGSGQPSVGDGTEMTIITAVIIGGTSLNGGAGTILGTVIGSLLMSVLSTGMNLIGVSAYWQRFVTGLIIIIAVGFDQYQRSKKRK